MFIQSCHFSFEVIDQGRIVRKKSELLTTHGDREETNAVVVVGYTAYVVSSCL